jgi:hypothetical protein
MKEKRSSLLMPMVLPDSIANSDPELETITKEQVNA